MTGSQEKQPSRQGSMRICSGNMLVDCKGSAGDSDMGSRREVPFSILMQGSHGTGGHLHQQVLCAPGSPTASTVPAAEQAFTTHLVAARQTRSPLALTPTGLSGVEVHGEGTDFPCQPCRPPRVEGEELDRWTRSSNSGKCSRELVLGDEPSCLTRDSKLQGIWHFLRPHVLFFHCYNQLFIILKEWA